MSIAGMNWVWANSPTSGNERLALADACSRDDGTGCLASAATIGRKANLSDRTVPRVIARLEPVLHDFPSGTWWNISRRPLVVSMAAGLAVAPGLTGRSSTRPRTARAGLCRSRQHW